MSSAGPLVIAAVLLAAVLHASWNAIAKGVADHVGLFARTAAVSIVFSGAALAVAQLTGASPHPASWPWLAASATIHTAYYLGLLAAYRIGDFNQTYPLARGIGPFVVAIVAATLLGERLHMLAVAGVLLIAAAIGVLGLTPWEAVRRNRPALIAAVCTGLAIAAYTLVDGTGVRRSGSPFGYAAWLLTLHTVAALAAMTLVRRRAKLAEQPAEHRPASWWLATAAAGMSMVAYSLVLWAQSRGALAAVAALRESSVVVAAVLGALLFKEPMGRVRIAASIAVAAGVVLLATA
jgi:drug/metabolite transporter (DMT)-like permease